MLMIRMPHSAKPRSVSRAWMRGPAVDTSVDVLIPSSKPVFRPRPGNPRPSSRPDATKVGSVTLRSMDRRRRLLRVAVDVLLAVVAAVVGGGLELTRDHSTKLLAAPVWTFVAAQIAAAALLLVRRRHPHTAALAIAAISLFAPAWASFLVPYAVTAFGRGRRW